MREARASEPITRSYRRPAVIGSAVVVALLAVGVLGWSYTCPCDRAPGAYLFGTAAEAPVNDWAFANQVPLCQIQISVGLLPHAINLNCMSTPTGQLYLSCSQCGTKRWSNAAVENGRARLRRRDRQRTRRRGPSSRPRAGARPGCRGCRPGTA